MKDEIDPDRGVTVAVGGQFCHALYQVVLGAVAPGGLYLPLAAVGVVVAAAGGLYSVRTLREQVGALRDERDELRTSRAAVESRRSTLEDELEEIRALVAARRTGRDRRRHGRWCGHTGRGDDRGAGPAHRPEL
jgi:methyl-accepting chemotaxis protein